MSKNFKPLVVVALIEITFSLIPIAFAKVVLIAFLWGVIFGEFKTIEISILPIVVFLGIFFIIFFNSSMLEMFKYS